VRQVRAALRRIQNHLRHLAQARVPFGFLADEFRTTQDHGQQIIEIVGDSSGQLAHRLHLLRLAELLLQLPRSVMSRKVQILP